MAKNWKPASNIGSVDVYIEADDIREILNIVPPTKVVDENGEEHARSAQFVIAGPKGGELRISLPTQYWAELEADVMSGTLKPGMGVSAIGWKRLFDKEGKPVMGVDGRQRRTFYPDGQRPKFWMA